jgi:hypothetical protein
MARLLRERVVRVATALALAGAVGCGAEGLDATPVLATTVVDAPGATGEGFGDPARATNGVRGAGPNAGSLDVYSLNYTSRPYLVLSWGGHTVRNGPGADFVVFENAFRVSGSAAYFMDPVIVSVSRDGEHWVDLPHAYLAPDRTRYSRDPEHWQGFAGRTPVLLHEESHPVDPFDPIAAGGDAFDLDLLGNGEDEAGAVRREGFRFVRLTSAAIVIDPKTGAPYPRDPLSDGADIDGVYARWVD